MTVFTYITFLLCASFERVLTGDMKRRASYKVRRKMRQQRRSIIQQDPF